MLSHVVGHICSDIRPTEAVLLTQLRYYHGFGFQIMTARRYDLDWLRVMVFGLLIFYHIGMVYVADWGFHYKSEHQAQWLKSIMILINQWRLPLLFLISGIAMRFLLNKVELLRFIGLRTLRLWLPLLFGIWVVVPPQLYVEMTVNGDLPDISYWTFYRAFFDLSHPYFEKYPSGIFPHVDVNHLWYIRELWYFSMYLLMIYLPLKLTGLFDYLTAFLAQHNRWSLLLVPALIMSLLSLTVFPDDSEGIRKAVGFSFLCWGFLMGWDRKFWQTVKHSRALFLILAIGSFAVLIGYYHVVFSVRAEAADGWVRVAEVVLVNVNRWLWILMILGYATHYLNHNHQWLNYLNQAVYPYYILHQSIIVVSAFYLASFDLGPIWEPLLVIIATFVGCALGFEVIRRFAPLRLLFGLKVGVSSEGHKQEQKKP
ncbi:acyltransferase-like protein [Marinicella litoralis]|uniref:Acyltransferase-like protein n=3 Tax=Marinicella litoralis TaxID=644220 RepID=A0A4R6XZ45_9GAMM|nr:acyltransferase-like protein [Marinicella litoralis]